MIIVSIWFLHFHSWLRQSKWCVFSFCSCHFCGLDCRGWEEIVWLKFAGLYLRLSPQAWRQPGCVRLDLRVLQALGEVDINHNETKATAPQTKKTVWREDTIFKYKKRKRSSNMTMTTKNLWHIWRFGQVWQISDCCAFQALFKVRCLTCLVDLLLSRFKAETSRHLTTLTLISKLFL